MFRPFRLSTGTEASAASFSRTLEHCCRRSSVRSGPRLDAVKTRSQNDTLGLYRTRVKRSCALPAQDGRLLRWKVPGADLQASVRSFTCTRQILY
ncbi:hypothetical protein LK10_05460 [Sinomonas humi]|uniref:Uncharacterized protein n=1 Tax=Sinomonas humi TaxID=1338436 RepID=A0A0B2ARH9_9MICC|nr:hypothetical protein LK10_05460 [Sinomonas humi]